MCNHVSFPKDRFLVSIQIDITILIYGNSYIIKVLPAIDIHIFFTLFTGTIVDIVRELKIFFYKLEST